MSHTSEDIHEQLRKECAEFLQNAVADPVKKHQAFILRRNVGYLRDHFKRSFGHISHLHPTLLAAIRSNNSYMARCRCVEIIDEALRKLRIRRVIPKPIVEKLQRLVLHFPVYSDVIITYILSEGASFVGDDTFEVIMNLTLRHFNAAWSAAKTYGTTLEAYTHGQESDFSFHRSVNHDEWCSVMDQ